MRLRAIKGIVLLCLGVTACAEEPLASARAVGAPCTDSRTCDGGRCIADLPGGYCSAACQSDRDCPIGSACEDRLCFDRCRDATSCRAGYACAQGLCQLFCTTDAECRPGEGCDASLGCLPLRE